MPSKIKQLRERAEIRNDLRGQAVTAKLDGPFSSPPGDNGPGNPETLTVLAREKVIVDAAVLRCADVARQLYPKGPLRVLRRFVPLPSDPECMFDLG